MENEKTTIKLEPDVFDEAIKGKKGAAILRQLWPLMPFFEMIFNFLVEVGQSDLPLSTEICNVEGPTGLVFWASSKGHTPVNRAIELAEKLRKSREGFHQILREIMDLRMGIEKARSLSECKKLLKSPIGVDSKKSRKRIPAKQADK